MILIFESGDPVPCWLVDVEPARPTTRHRCTLLWTIPGVVLEHEDGSYHVVTQIVPVGLPQPGPTDMMTRDDHVAPLVVFSPGRRVHFPNGHYLRGLDAISVDPVDLTPFFGVQT